MFRRPNRIIVAQYAPPPGLSVVAAAELLGEGRRAIAAQIVDLAVRKVITIGREPGKGRRSGFTLTYTGSEAGGQDEQAILVTLFSGIPSAGTSIRIAPGATATSASPSRHPTAGSSRAWSMRGSPVSRGSG